MAIRQQAPLKVDPQIDELITNSAHFLGLTKKELVAEAVRAYVEQRREEIRVRMQEVMELLDGTRASTWPDPATIRSVPAPAPNGQREETPTRLTS